jgi:hypothetical protein
MRYRPWMLLPVLLSFVSCLHTWAEGDGVPVSHTGKPLPVDMSHDADIAITPSPCPPESQEETGSPDGHFSLVVMKDGGAGHTNRGDVFVHCPGGKDFKITFKNVYWDISQGHWINEDLLFLRIWWGRHWGSDYIIDADTAKVIYSEEFDQIHTPTNE